MTILLNEMMADPDTGWALGTFGAIGEFVRDRNEPAEICSSDGTSAVHTARGGLRLEASDDLRLVAYETSTGNGWSQALALCLPEGACMMNQRTVLTEVGADTDALRVEDMGGILFDLGLGCRQLDVMIRVRAGEADVLRPFLGRSLFEPGNPAMGEIFRLQPHRVFLTRIGRAEVYQPIPMEGGVSPEGPHTHILPKLLKSGRTHAATSPIPEGLVPCGYAFPPHPARDAYGRPTPFDTENHRRFEALLDDYGNPRLVAIKREVLACLRDGGEVNAATQNRAERIAARVALAQSKVLWPQMETSSLQARLDAYADDLNDDGDRPAH